MRQSEDGETSNKLTPDKVRKLAGTSKTAKISGVMQRCTIIV